ncbi:MAG: SH3 domain-containing protein [Candidatus Sericytochromatia bacterium]
MKRIDKVLAALSALVLASAAWLSVPAQSREMCTDLRVSGSIAYMKSGPGMGYGTLRTAKHGEWLAMTGTQPRGHWNEVKSRNGTTGWVHDSVIRCNSGVISKMTCSQVRVVGPSGAFLKSQPRLNARTFRIAPRGEILNLESPGSPIEYNGWFLLRSAAGNKYWAHESVINCK